MAFQNNIPNHSLFIITYSLLNITQYNYVNLIIYLYKNQRGGTNMLYLNRAVKKYASGKNENYPQKTSKINTNCTSKICKAYGTKVNSKIKVKPNINISILILILIMSILFIRLGNVLKNNKERGAFAYVQLLNLGMPIIESQIYDEGTYVENKLSLKNVCIQVLGLNNLNYKNI